MDNKGVSPRKDFLFTNKSRELWGIYCRNLLFLTEVDGQVSKECWIYCVNIHPRFIRQQLLNSQSCESGGIIVAIHLNQLWGANIQQLPLFRRWISIISTTICGCQKVPYFRLLRNICGGVCLRFTFCLIFHVGSPTFCLSWAGKCAGSNQGMLHLLIMRIDYSKWIYSLPSEF